MKLIKDINIILRDRIVKGSIVFSERIEKIIMGEGDYSLVNDSQLEHIEVNDACYLSPGFIDIHVHGAAGSDIMDASQEALTKIKESLLESGVISFLPTTMSMPVEDIKRSLAAVRMNMCKEVTGSRGARILGVHLEGPFLNKKYKGAHTEENIVLPDFNLINEFIDIIKIVTLAPEIEGIGKLISFLRDKGIVCSAGHSAASYEEMLAAIDSGISHITHLFNAMPGLHHRNPGIIGTALTTDISVELIADFIHIHPAVLKLVLQAKDPGQIILVTDQMQAATLQDGEYELGGQRVMVKDGIARLDDGSLAGSTLRLDQAVRNIRKISELPLYQIINMVSYNPARLLGLAEELGWIKEGNRADLVLLDRELRVRAVFKDGFRQI